MPAKTATHTLQLVAGPLRVDITEAPDAVFFAISGVKPMGFEKNKLVTFLWPLIDAYRDDTRRMEVSGQHSRLTGYVRPMVDGMGWVGYQAWPKGWQ